MTGVQTCALPICDDFELRARFLREARSLAQIASPHVVRIVDFQANPGEVAFLAMEYLQGQNAGELLRLRGPFSAREVLPLAKQMFAGLSAMHALGLVHRTNEPECRKGKGCSCRAGRCIVQ